MKKENTAIVAVCRFDVESLGVGLDNKLELEPEKDIDADEFSIPSVYALCIGRITEKGKKSKFIDDKESGTTEKLDACMASGKCVEVYKTFYNSDNTMEYGREIFVPYDITDHPTFKKTSFMSEENPEINEDAYIEVIFRIDGYIKPVYFRCASSWLFKNIQKFMDCLDDIINEYLAEEEIAGFKKIDDALEVEFFNEAGESGFLNFDSSSELINTISSIRFI